MIQFRPGSHVWRIVMLLSVVGEFPMRSLAMLGNVRAYDTLVRKLRMVQTIRNCQTGMELTCRLLTVSGKGDTRSIRLYKGALPILDWLWPGARVYYLHAFWNHRFPGDAAHRERNHRVAEVAAVCLRTGMEARPYMLPALQNREILQVVPETPCFYLSKNVKHVGEAEMNKTMFTRMTGVIFSGGSCYAVYNTRRSVMKWNGMGEFKTRHSLIELARLNAGISEVDSAILLGQSEEIALQTLLESDQSRNLPFRFDSIYQHIYFIPMQETGIRQMRILMAPDWKEQLLSMLFDLEERSFDRGMFEYDACVDGVYVLSHLDGDIARLVRFREAVQNQSGRYEILCFPHQARFLGAYVGKLAAIKTISLEVIEAELNLKRRDLFHG